MKVASSRVYIAFLMGEKDGTVLTNAARLMKKRGVDEKELLKVPVEVELSLDLTDPKPVGVELKVLGSELAKIKLALSQLNDAGELILLGHGGKRLFAGLDGETLFKTLKDWGFKKLSGNRSLAYAALTFMSSSPMRYSRLYQYSPHASWISPR